MPTLCSEFRSISAHTREIEIAENDFAGAFRQIVERRLRAFRRLNPHSSGGKAVLYDLADAFLVVHDQNRMTAERCVDEELIAELRCDPARYARTLLTVLELKQTLRPVPVFPGMKPVEITSIGAAPMSRAASLLAPKTIENPPEALTRGVAFGGHTAAIVTGRNAEPLLE